jgi:hypothetical protein
LVASSQRRELSGLRSPKEASFKSGGQRIRSTG